MGVASLVLGLIALAVATAGFFVSFTPGASVVAAILSLGSPIFALIGIVLGGVSLSRAQADGTERGLPIAGLTVSIVAFFPALFVAVFCGLCDVLCASMPDAPPGGAPPTPWYLIDAGAGGSPGLGPTPDPYALPPGVPVDPSSPVDPGAAPVPSASPDPGMPEPSAAPDPSAPAPAFPPPPP